MHNNINKLLLLSILGLVTLTSSSCGFLMKTTAGIKNPKIMDEKLHTRYLKKMKAPRDQAYLIDTNYINFLKVNDTLHFREQKKNHYQLIQAIYYGHNQFQEAWFINCYAPGFPHLNWNIENKFATFPPKTAAPNLADMPSISPDLDAASFCKVSPVASMIDLSTRLDFD